MTRVISLAAIVASLSSPAFAGNVSEPVIEPAPAPVVALPPPNLGGDWTGAYVGGQIGQLDVDTTAGLEGDDVAYGLHGGYNYDFGRFVLGGEVDYDATDIDLGGAATVDSVLRGKIKAGYDFGPVLAYLTGGVARVDTSLGDETGEFYGLGVAYQVTDQWIVGAEVLEHEFDDIGGSGIGADARSMSLRASFRF